MSASNISLMAQIICNDCGRTFDEKGLVQCPHCSAPIGTLHIYKREIEGGKTRKNEIASRIGTRSSRGTKDMLIEGEEGCDIDFEERPGKAKYSANNPYPGSLRNIIVLFFSLFSICAFSQKKPTLMILPSDNWCTQRYFTTEYDNQGVKERIANYRQAFQEDLELSPVISKIGELLTSFGYSLKDAEMELKNISARTSEDNVTYSKSSGAQLTESPLDMLKRRAKADIIIQIGWIVNSTSVTFTLEAFDAYTSKRIATSTATENRTTDAIPVQLQLAVEKHIKPFDKQLDVFYSNMKSNGREIVLTIRTWDNWDGDLESEYNNEELLGHIQQWLTKNTVKEQFNLSDATENFAQFEQVMIPLKNESGAAIDARSFARGLQKKLNASPFNIPSKLMMRGLGEAILVLGEK